MPRKLIRQRHYIYLDAVGNSKLTWEWVDNYCHDNNIQSRGEAFEKIFCEYQSLRKEVSDRTSLAKTIAKEIKPQLDPIRIRTGYVDKNIRVLLNLLNSYIIINGMEDSIPVTDVVAESVRNTQKQVSDQIHAYQVARKDKLTRAAEGEDDE